MPEDNPNLYIHLSYRDTYPQSTVTEGDDFNSSLHQTSPCGNFRGGMSSIGGMTLITLPERT